LKNIKYLPHIDGLRALAVISVVIFHLNIVFKDSHILHGGFLGVDIFFVITGYLISQILLLEKKNKKFSLKNFYIRRARRIIPCALFIIIITLFFSINIHVEKDIKETTRTLLPTLFFFLNFFLYYQKIEYNPAEPNFIVFNHFWSLSLEEQFYFIFPLLFFSFFYKNFRKIIIFLFASSLISLLYISKYNSMMAFYFFFSRAWEILLGVLIALYKEKIYNSIHSLKIKNTIQTVSFLIIIVLLFKASTHNFSKYIILTTVSAALIIVFHNKNFLISKILSSKIAIYVGLISYSIYLWHYPIISILEYQDYLKKTDIFKEPVYFFKLLLIFLITVFLSVLTYKFIENPFRRRKFISNKKFFFLIFLTISLTISYSIFINQYFFSKNNNKFDEQIFKLEKQIQQLDKNKKNTNCYSRKDNFCTFNSNKNINVYLIGSSMTQPYEKAVVDNNDNYNLKLMTHHSCPFFTDEYEVLLPSSIGAKTLIKTGCDTNYQKNRFSEILKTKNNIIIFEAGQLVRLINQSPFDDLEDPKPEPNNLQIVVKKNMIDTSSQYLKLKNEFDYVYKKETQEKIITNAINEIITKIINNNNYIILIYPQPEFEFDVAKKIYVENRKNKNFFKEGKYFSVSKDAFIQDSKKIYNIFDSINNSSQKIYKVYPKDILCDDRQCLANKGGEIYYFDKNHLSYKGANLIFNEVLKNIFTIRNRIETLSTNEK
jgi:peptidoglycan/LPS O-acetylase OafA/YrhL